MTYRFIVLAIITVGCAPRPAPVELGKTTKAALITQKGEPQRVEHPTGTQGPELLVYENEEKFQINQSQVVEASFREPTAEERSLLHWRHRLRSCDTEFVDSGSAVNDQRSLKELRCRPQGVVVLYDPNVDQVIRVVEHAQ